MFLNQGKDMITNLLLGSNMVWPAYCSVGSDSTAVTINDTTLGSEYKLSRAGWDSQTKQTNAVELEMVLPTTSPADSMPCMIREVGVFSGSPTGSMFSRNVMAELEKTDEIEMQFIIGYKVV